MPLPLASDSVTDISREKLTQLAYLCVLLGAINETCKSMENRTYSSGNQNCDTSLTEFQIFLNLLAQILDTQKGNTTITALACLIGLNGTEFVFCSNFRKETELEHTKAFLSRMLDFVSTNPEKLATMALRKKVLWIILEYNSKRVTYYLNSLSSAVEECILNYQEREELEDPGFSRQLSLFQEKANFSFDLSSDNSRSKSLRDCETLIKAIDDSKKSSFLSIVNSQVRDDHPDRSYDWCNLRHYLGRLYSYREAARAIVDAPSRWPDLFKDFTVRYIHSARPRRIPISSSLPLEQLLEGSFPDRNLSGFTSDITTLRKFGLDENICSQFQKIRSEKKGLVHAEVQLYDHLVRQGKTRSSDFWGSSAFIATSKPPCRLCHLYFDYYDNNIMISPSHMNLYPRWLFPEVKKEDGREVTEKFKNQLEEIIEDLQDDTERILTEKLAVWKRNDSRTDSYGRISGMSRDAGVGSRTIRSADTTGGSVLNGTSPSLSSIQSWNFIREKHLQGDESSSEN